MSITQSSERNIVYSLASHHYLVVQGDARREIVPADMAAPGCSVKEQVERMRELADMLEDADDRLSKSQPKAGDAPGSLPKKDPTSTAVEMEKRFSNRDEKLLQITALMLGLNQLASDAEKLGTKVFYRMLREEAYAEFTKLGGKIDKLTEPPTLHLITRPEVKFYETDIEAMRELVREYDAKDAEKKGTTP
jgi:hypothetical protein